MTRKQARGTDSPCMYVFLCAVPGRRPARTVVATSLNRAFIYMKLSFFGKQFYLLLHLDNLLKILRKPDLLVIFALSDASCQ